MFRNSSRLRQERKQTSQNLHSSDIKDFPTNRVHGNFIMWDEHKQHWVTSGKDAVTSAELNTAIDNLIGGAPNTLDTLKEIADAIGNPGSTTNDLITRLNQHNTTIDLLTVTQPINLNAITTSHISDGSITVSKLAAGSVSIDKIVNNSISTNKLDTNCVTTNKIDNNAVTTSKILDGNITNSKYAEGSITSSKLANGFLTINHIPNGIILSLIHI